VYKSKSSSLKIDVLMEDAFWEPVGILCGDVDTSRP